MWLFKRAINLVSSSTQETSAKPDSDILFAIKKVEKLLSLNDTTLSDICFAVESAETKDQLRLAFQPFNRVMRILRIAVPDIELYSVIISALKILKCSERFTFHMESTSSIHDAIIGYKSAVIKKMQDSSQRREQLRICDNAFDNSLLTCNLDNTFENGPLVARSRGRKRKLSQVTDILGEYYPEESDPGLQQTILVDLPSNKKRATIKSQLTNLLERQCSGFNIQTSSNAREPKVEVQSSGKKKTWWDDVDNRRDIEFTSKRG